MTKHLRGTHVPHRKNTADMHAVWMDSPKTVILPTTMHIGAPALPVVKAGDHVDVGTLVAAQNGVVSSPVYASVSGTVKKVDEILLSNGSMGKAIFIESDGAMTEDPNLKVPVVETRRDLDAAVRDSGVVGLGGAGFPTYVKFGAGKDLDIRELIINGAECEPYITSDSVTMMDRAEDMAYAIDVLARLYEIERVIIGIEANKPKAIEAMKKMVAENHRAEVQVLPALYPQGGEKVLIYHTTGKVVPMGKLPIDVGCVVCNCTTVAAIGKYLKTGMPLVNKCITIDGGAVKEPKNVIAPIGTPIKDVYEFAGGFKEPPAKVLYGGPMMGIAVPDLEVPVLKNTNALIALNEKEAAPVKTTACIRCGNCTNHCPFGINPANIARAFKKNDMEALEKLGVNLCMECGCCNFCCPANRPLVQTNKLAKAALRTAAMKAKEAK